MRLHLLVGGFSAVAVLSCASSNTNGGSPSGSDAPTGSDASSGGSSGGSASSGGSGSSSGGGSSSGSGGGSGGSSDGGASSGASSGSGGGSGGSSDGGSSSGTSSGSGGGSGGSSDGGSSGAGVGQPDGGTAENTGAGCPPITEPAFSALPTIASLPDPFTSVSGTNITKKSDWTCRREELLDQLQDWELGKKTPATSTVTGSVSGGTITVNVASGGKSISFAPTVTLPSSGKAPYPVMIGVNGVFLNTTALAQQGVAVVNFPADDLGAENSASSRGQGKFFTLFGADAGAGATIAWAWGISRFIDFIEANPSAQLDPTRVGVTGCSRNGKGALVAGAFDERIVLTIPQESGGGGSASWRITDAFNAALPAGEMTTSFEGQPLSEIIGENAWFSSTLNQFSGHTTQLPFDHHELEGLVAPRALLVIENDINWLSPLSSFEGSTAANTIWQALGIPDHMAYSLYGNHAHCSFPAAQQPDVDAYVLKFLVGGGTANTAFLKATNSTAYTYTYDTAKWQPWTVPMLQ
jgi:hypothetical protein